MYWPPEGIEKYNLTVDLKRKNCVCILIVPRSVPLEEVSCGVQASQRPVKARPQWPTDQGAAALLIGVVSYNSA